MSLKWTKAGRARLKIRDALDKSSDPALRPGVSRSTFREDPLPDRPMRDRGVTLPKLNFLERKENPAPEANLRRVKRPCRA